MSSRQQQQQQQQPTDTTIPLLHAAKRVLALPRLPPYATDLVRSIVREVRERDAIVNQLLLEHGGAGDGAFDPARDPGTACRLLVEHLGIRRGKRCLLGYHAARVGRLEEGVWAGKEDEMLAGGSGGEDGDAFARGDAAGGGGDNNNNSSSSNLSPEEEEYVRGYAEVLAGLKGQWTDIDLTGPLEPPRDLFTDVRVLKDAGVVQTEYGELNLTKNSQFFVRVGDVEGLIRGGYLKRLDD